MTATDQTKFTDGRLHESEVFGEAHTRFPFKDNPTPDRHARIHTRKFWIDPHRYVAKVTQRTSYTNLLSLSDVFDVATWTDQTMTRVANVEANPWDGLASSVDRLAEIASSSEQRTGRPYTFTAQAHVLWAILKPYNGRRYWRLRINDGTNNFDGIFDLVAGQRKSSAGSGVSTGLRKLDDGYFQVWVSGITLAAAGAINLAASADGSTFTYAGDTTKGCYLAQLQLEPATAPGPLILTAGAGRSVLAPERDPHDIFAYLATESDLADFAAGLCTVVREYARIPRAQLTYPKRKFITKPDYTPPTAFNPYTTNAEYKGLVSAYTDFAALGNASYAAATGLFTDGDNKIYYPMKSGGAGTPGYASGGTFVLTRGADSTSALAYNATPVDIAAALTGLASWPGGMGVTVGSGGVGPNTLGATSGGALSFAFTGGSDVDRAVPITLDPSSLTVSTSKHAVTSRINAFQQQIQLVTHVTVTGHGLNTGAALAAVWGNPTVFIYASGEWGSVDSNTIWLPNWYNNGVAVEYVGNYSSTYSGPVNPTYAGGQRLPAQRLYMAFALPGVTLGVTTPADIVIPVGLQNPDTFLSALQLPLTGWQDYEPDGPTPWAPAPLIYASEMLQVWFQDLV